MLIPTALEVVLEVALEAMAINSVTIPLVPSFQTWMEPHGPDNMAPHTSMWGQHIWHADSSRPQLGQCTGLHPWINPTC